MKTDAIQPSRTRDDAPLASTEPKVAGDKGTLGPTAHAPAHSKKSKLETATREFEAIFVRSMLEQSNAFGKKGNAYGDMALSTLAATVTAGKGLGLAQVIQKAVEASESRRGSPRGAPASAVPVPVPSPSPSPTSLHPAPLSPASGTPSSSPTTKEQKSDEPR